MRWQEPERKRLKAWPQSGSVPACVLRGKPLDCFQVSVCPSVECGENTFLTPPSCQQGHHEYEGVYRPLMVRWARQAVGEDGHFRSGSGLQG